MTWARSALRRDLTRGEIETADRYNYVGVTGGEVTGQVRETYVYAGTGGRVSARDTQTYVDGATSEGFTPGWSYNDLGEVTTLTYPRYIHAGCNGAALTSRTVTFGYTNGWLSSVPGYANSIT